MADLSKAADIVLNKCMRAKKDEEVLIVTDEPCKSVGLALWDRARELGCDVVLAEIRPRQTNGQEPPASVARAMLGAKVCLLATSKSLSHTRARKEATAAGIRIASLPGITEEIMGRALMADYEQIAGFTRKVAEKMRDARRATVKSPSGTNITFSVEGRPVHPDTGIYTEPDAFGNLPAGEVYLAPVEGTANGVVVVDGSFAAIGLVDAPVRIEVKDGLAVKISGGESARQLESLFDAAGPDARNVAELGVGTNGKATLTGNILEDEKVLGTAHIAFGSNATFGGKVQVASHLDGIILKATVFVDEKPLMQDGKLLV
ncbi:MAG: aminopeptidase [Syntrophothermus sp.]